MSIPERNQTDAPGTPLNQKGTQVFDKQGWTIRRVVLSYAYARNGNVHNPTPNLTFIIFNPAGERRGSARLLRLAKQDLTELIEEQL